MTTVLGIRHMSPACARNLRQSIRKLRPDLLLLELPEDMGAYVCSPKKYPVFVVSYEEKPPRRPLRLPLADYSPEVVAVKECQDLGIPIRFMDMPSAAQRLYDGAEETESAFLRYALEHHEKDFDDAWERQFEHDDSYFWERTLRFGQRLRSMILSSPLTRRREHWMLARLRDAEREGYERILCVCGAYHAPVLAGLGEIDEGAGRWEPWDRAAERFSSLPASRLCVIPATQRSLSLGGGCASGNRSPAYHGLLWENPADAPPRFLTLLGRALRKEGVAVGTEDIQAALGLAQELAAMKNGAVILRDLLDAGALCFPGDKELFWRTAEGVYVGGGQGVCREDMPSPLCADIGDVLRTKRLAATEGGTNLRRLDLTKPADRERSHCLHRLHILDLGLCVCEAQNGPKERWALIGEPSWVTLALQREGDSLEEAALLRIAHACRGDGGGSGDGLRRLSLYVLCGLPLTEVLDALEQDARRWEDADTESFVRVTLSLDSWAARDGDTQLVTARQRFFRRSLRSLALTGGRETQYAVLHRIAESHQDLDNLWRSWLRRRMGAEDISPYLRGLCLSLRLERYEAEEGLLESCFAQGFGGKPTETPLFMQGLLSQGRLRILRDKRLWRLFAHWLGSLSDSRFDRLRPSLFAAFFALEPEEKELLRNGEAPLPITPPDAGMLALLKGLGEL